MAGAGGADSPRRRGEDLVSNTSLGMGNSSMSQPPGHLGHRYGSGRRLPAGRPPMQARRSSEGRPPPHDGAFTRRSESPPPLGSSFGRGSPSLESPGRSGRAASPRDVISVGSGGKAVQSNVQVMVRVRPFSQEEIATVQRKQGYMQSVIDMPRSDQCLLLDHEHDYETKQAFSFDRVFWSIPKSQQVSPVGFATQTDVYEHTGAVALQAAWEAFNSCVFAYGQTGSGKTHTMMGDPALIAQSPRSLKEDDVGVIPRLCRQLFQDIEARKQVALKAGIQKDFRVQVSFVEIYNEKVKDLLNSSSVCHNWVRSIRGRGSTVTGSPSFGGRTPGAKGDSGEHRAPPGIDLAPRPSGAAAAFTAETHMRRDPKDIAPKPEPDLKVREHPTEGPIVDGVTVHEPNGYHEIIGLINHGNRERHTAHTKVNDRSSRSHAVFRISLRQVSYFDRQRIGITGPGQQSSERRANINLVDLAGSENVKKSGAQGSTLTEAQKINVSLTTLRRVIDALIDRKSRSVVPYRDSTLTWLLRTDLGGNSKCIMLATVSPHPENTTESQRTLQYAMRARSIVNTVRTNEDDTAALLEDLEKRIRQAQQEMDAQGLSSDQRDRLLEELQEAQSARLEMQGRLAEMAARAAEFQDMLEQERRKRADKHLRNCHVMREVAEKQAELAGRHAETAAQVEQMKAKLRDTGHEDVDSLTLALQHTKQREAELQAEKQRLHLQVEEQRRQAEEQAKLFEREHETKQGENRERSEQLQRELEDASVERERLRVQLDELAEANQAEKEQMSRDHQHMRRALLHEMEAAATQFERDQEQYHREVADTEEQGQRHVRQAEHWADAKVRVLQELEERLRGDLAVAKGEHQSAQTQLSALQQSLESQKAKLRDDLQGETAQLEAEGQKRAAALREERERLRRRLAEAEAEAAEQARVRTQVQHHFQEIAQQENVYRLAFEEISAFFDYVRTEDIPPQWAVPDFRRALEGFRRFQRSYSSHRPSREQLRQMLRDDPNRSGADGIRTLLTHRRHPDQQEEQGGTSAQCQVLLDGLRCPDLPSARRSVSVPAVAPAGSPTVPNGVSAATPSPARPSPAAPPSAAALRLSSRSADRYQRTHTPLTQRSQPGARAQVPVPAAAVPRATARRAPGCAPRQPVGTRVATASAPDPRYRPAPRTRSSSGSRLRPPLQAAHGPRKRADAPHTARGQPAAFARGK